MRYIQDPETLELIPADQYEPKRQVNIHIMPDIQPYKSMIDGSLITSRSKHRQHLREHGCVEVGNDPIVKNPKYKPLEAPPGLKETIIREFHKRNL